MTLTIEVTHSTLALLQAEARRDGLEIEAVAAERLSDIMVAGIDPAALAAIREGLAEADAGQLISLEEYKQRFNARQQALK